jgi:cytochrome c oxidase assembly factor CtaG
LGFLVRLRVSLTAWVLVMASWHVPLIYDYAASHQLVHDVEHLSFVIVGVLVWTQLIDPGRHGRLGVPQRLVYALALFVFGQVLADLMILTFTPLYAHYAGQPARVDGISPLSDQRLAGFVMMIEQAITLGAFSFLLYNRGRSPTGLPRGRMRRPEPPRLDTSV